LILTTNRELYNRTLRKAQVRGLTGYSLRYTVSLNAATAITKSSGDESLTYLNRGQTYSIRILDTSTLSQPTKYRTSIGLSFQNHQQRQDKTACWQTWSNLRSVQSSQEQQHGFQAVEFVDPAKIGFLSSASSRLPKVELLDSALDGFAIQWCPAPESTRELVVALRFNVVSTDFNSVKGENNIAIRLCVKTEAEEPMPSSEICYCKVLFLREHGADRKQSDDLTRIRKRMEDLELRIAMVDSKSPKSFSASHVADHWKHSIKPSSHDNNRTAFRNIQQSRLQSLLTSSNSSTTITHLNLRGEFLDDPDIRPYSLFDSGMFGGPNHIYQPSPLATSNPQSSPLGLVHVQSIRNLIPQQKPGPG
jgi:hypothetical protein